ncbi:hypothetical protein SETIT_1G196100v2 [Setaria italica]|uniref:DUF6821 domain-containing protein n=1 Tax=Setaria italica TaxID=4555 RepID=K3YTF6_SETIT|nr:uncharacterized protein LOC101763552 [Setaria italica]RCV06842.1 hypothetical protein SETIT_1G196100v2 [Setaria italica]
MAEPGAATAMDDAASEISDWEVLSAASGCGGGAADDDDSEVVVVSGGGGDVLHVHDHFALAPAGPDPRFPGEGPWTETGDPWQGLELLDDENPRASFDLAAGVWSEQQVPAGGVDEAREGPILEATVARGVTWGEDGSQAEVVDGLIEQESNVVIDHGELGSVLQPAHHGLGETLDSDAATPTGASLQIEGSETESSPVQLDGGEIDAGVESSCLEDAVASDGIRGEQEEQEQGGNASAASGSDEPDGEAKDGDLPLAHTPGAEEGDKQVVVWWKLPFRLLHYCAWKVKPVWSFSIAAALLGLVVLGRRMYRMKRKARGLPQIKIAFDDKRTSQFADRAARLNEAFLVARRVPLLRTSSGAVLPWSMVQER